MPIVTDRVCKHCGVAIEPLDALAGTWIHTGLSIYCPGSGDRFTAHPVIRVVPMMPVAWP